MSTAMDSSCPLCGTYILAGRGHLCYQPAYGKPAKRLACQQCATLRAALTALAENWESAMGRGYSKSLVAKVYADCAAELRRCVEGK